MKVDGFLVMQGESFEEKGELILLEFLEKISRMWNEYRLDLVVRKVLEILVSRLDGQLQVDELERDGLRG